MALSHTAKLVLGLVASGRRSGYEIKQVVDRWTHWFWGASVGGIYPELRRLEADGLLAAADDPRGAGARRAHTLTPAGDRAWRAWLEDEAVGVVDIRHEGALRLFFADALGADATADLLRRLAAEHGRLARELRAAEIPEDKRDALGLLSLDLGIALHGFLADWCADAAERSGRLRMATGGHPGAR